MSIVSLIFGGNDNKTVIAELEVDCVVSEKHGASSEITTNPVESGINVTDHIQPKPKTLTIEGVYSDTPVSLLGTFGVSLVNAFGAGLSESRVTDALNFFQELSEEPKLIDIVTPFRNYSSMALQDLSIPRTKDTGQALYFTATFVEVRVVETSLIAIAAGAAKSVSKLGKQSTKAVSPSAEKKSGSVAKSLFDKVGLTQPGSGI